MVFIGLSWEKQEYRIPLISLERGKIWILLWFFLLYIYIDTRANMKKYTFIRVIENLSKLPVWQNVPNFPSDRHTSYWQLHDDTQPSSRSLHWWFLLLLLLHANYSATQPCENLLGGELRSVKHTLYTLVVVVSYCYLFIGIYLYTIQYRIVHSKILP